ncbi:type III secretion chaperone [Candidatus Aerophobetes bacterium]|uniref:Type III secretion chaperone n=1 Tax=Aerophobetes bacterium TaxID=2030807 RepID=A0A2A4X5A4_UNCAE|nr:MAG: type III secretion chaperone [Candidatus Aerophobetes bacterium]
MAKKEEWLQLLGWNKDNLEDLRFVGYDYIKQGHYSIALNFFGALAKLPTTPEVYDIQTLGALYLELGNHRDALHFLEKALGLDPMDETTLLNRAKTLFMLGYTQQGLTQVGRLTHSDDATIRGQALALSQSYA